MIDPQTKLTLADRQDRFLTGCAHLLLGPGLVVLLLTIGALLGWRHG